MYRVLNITLNIILKLILNIYDSLAFNRSLAIRRNKILRQVSPWQVYFLERGRRTNSNYISGSKAYATRAENVGVRASIKRFARELRDGVNLNTV